MKVTDHRKDLDAIAEESAEKERTQDRTVLLFLYLALQDLVTGYHLGKSYGRQVEKAEACLDLARRNFKLHPGDEKTDLKGLSKELSRNLPKLRTMN